MSWVLFAKANITYYQLGNRTDLDGEVSQPASHFGDEVQFAAGIDVALLGLRVDVSIVVKRHRTAAPAGLSLPFREIIWQDPEN